MAATSGMEKQMNKVTRALIVGLVVMTSVATGKKAAAMAAAQPQASLLACCGDPPPCPGMPMCPVN
jgi:hypothetical protein